jgi:formate--tetrahydrofolate ligase
MPQIRTTAVVVVATIRALKYHGGCDLKQLNVENLEALEKGIANLQRHVSNVRNHYGLPCVVSVNHFTSDTAAEQAVVSRAMAALDVPVILSRCWAEGGEGATDLARKVVEIVDGGSSSFSYVYEESQTLWDKIKAVATKIYGAADITAEAKVRKQLDTLQADGYGKYPVCIAKTQYSFSTDPSARGAPTGHIVDIREVRLAAGAEFIVVICGDVMTMPGLPKVPAAENIDIGAGGQVVGLF